MADSIAATPYQLCPANGHARSYAQWLLNGQPGLAVQMLEALPHSIPLAVVPQRAGDLAIRRYSHRVQGDRSSAVLKLSEFVRHNQPHPDTRVIVQDLWERAPDEEFDLPAAVEHNQLGSIHYFSASLVGLDDAAFAGLFHAPASPRVIGAFHRCALSPFGGETTMALGSLKGDISAYFMSAYAGEGFLIYCIQ